MAEPKFEKDLERLEHLVAKLEEGGLSLDESLKHFEEGVKLAKRCEKALTDAEKKIEILTKNAQGKVEAKSFGKEEDDSEETAEPATEETPEGDPGELLF